MKMGEALYKAQAAEAQASAPGSDEAGGAQSSGAGGGQGGGKSDRVVDADFEEVDPNKKKSG